MLPAMIVDLLSNNSDWVFFALSFCITGFIGTALYLASRQGRQNLSTRQAMVLTTLTWFFLTVFGALPFYLSGITPHYVDAFFETMSGLTTTGATILTNLDNMPPGILFWRSTLQWLGGLGIIVMAVAVLPMLQIGGMQVFKAEAFDTPDKILPRARQISSSLIGVFCFFTLLCALAFMAAGMGPADAINHAMTTVSTGGFSTRDASIGGFNSATIDWVCILFMVIGSLPFLGYVKMLQGQREAIIRDSQVRAFIGLLLFLAPIGILISHNVADNNTDVLARTVFFNIVSVITGTGFGAGDFGSWGSADAAFFFGLMFIGGCAGSTSCGIKIFRFQLIFAEIFRHSKAVFYPNGIFILRYNGRKINDATVRSVISFFILYFISFTAIAIALRLVGLDFVTAISGAATSISNVGPGLGPIIGPAGNFSSLNDAAKWILSFGMLLGRLELFAILVLLMPRFWMD